MIFKNVSTRVLFLLTFIITMAACHSLRPVSSGTRSNQTRKSPSKAETDLRKDMTKYALRLEGSKYKYGAKGPKRFDCSGFTLYIYQNYDRSLPAGSYNQARLGKKVSLSKAQAGDLVFFGKGGKVNHVALIVKNSNAGIEVVHSTSSRGVIRENVSKSNYWKSRILYARNLIDG